MNKDFDFNGFRKDVELLLKELEGKYNVKISGGPIVVKQYGFALDVYAEENDGHEELLRFINLCKEYGFDLNDYKRTTQINGTCYRLIGFTDSGHENQNNCLIQRVADGKRYVCNADLVYSGFQFEKTYVDIDTL